eukprot:TRINITY_DN3066_c0_g1_i1.p1 TRINITY_DN3066_c0_g1~~TRINITY_DN3066_c0_g1_i1.p1  ORF type:complete len:337 (-),score=64.25 TRINITY_DN3066_c0_g1_i1:24-944(-)
MITVLEKSQEKIISRDDLDSIFLNFKEIYSVHKIFFDKTGNRIEEWNDSSIISDIFEEFIPSSFKEYSLYCSNHLYSLHKFLLFRSSNSQFEHTVKFFDNANHLKPQPGTLVDYLTLPLSRIRCYTTFSENILKVTKPSHHEHQRIAKMLDDLTLNQSQLSIILDMEAARDTHKLITIALSFTDQKGHSLVKTGRKLAKEGAVKSIKLFEKGKKNSFKQTYIHLFDDIIVLSIQRRKTDTHTPFSLISAIPLNGKAEINILTPFKLKLIVSPEKPEDSSVEIKFDKEQVQFEWLTEINSVVRKFIY